MATTCRRFAIGDGRDDRSAVDGKPAMIVLALNSGSSSLKFGLYRVGAARLEVLLSGEAESIGSNTGKFSAIDSREQEVAAEVRHFANQSDAFARIALLLSSANVPTPTAIGHRVVHGGAGLRVHCAIDDAVLRQLKAAATFAPLHAPAALAVIDLSRKHFPGLPQVACFDTTFHATMPDVARVLPIPRALQAEGVQRYGFHGLSCESIVRQLAGDTPERVPDRLVIAHLGNGASVTAVKHGKSIDTSMGLTPTGGVIMGTRSGDIDPGVLIYLLREKKYAAATLEKLLNQQSGMIGISGISSDMRRLHEAAPTNAHARLAVLMFCYSVRKQIASMIAALDGVDRLVFTGGIGENDAEVRASICAGLSWIGMSLDESRNQSGTNPINTPASRCAINVLSAEEDKQIARHTGLLCSAS